MPSKYELELVKSLRAGFISGADETEHRYIPKVLSNDADARIDVLSTLKTQLSKCDRFDFSVAFITSSGIESLIQILLTLRDKGVPGRILTTTYNNFNDPEALRKLLELPNIEVRVFEGNMHTKGYFFKEGELNAVIVGSANLTQAALCVNKEWSIMLHSLEDGELYQSIRREYELLWRAPQTVPLTSEWVDLYEQYRCYEEGFKPAPRKPSFVSGLALGENASSASKGETRYASVTLTSAPSSRVPITPNAMQRSALESLEKLHAQNAERALLISATGTGKTYLSAFDVRATKPARVLFVAHRERILEASKESFERVLGSEYTYAIYGGGRRDRAQCTFAMVNTLARHLDEFDPLEFDYIIFDEAHRTGAQGYRKVMSYFAPKFMLGMTATPQRSDGYDVFALFNHVIAYRITLHDALREDMLAPFHYYGISDIAVDGEGQDDLRLFQRLTSRQRVNHIIEKLEDYSVEKTQRRGLIFCSRIDEAARLSEEFNARGYRTRALSGADSNEARNKAVAALEAGELQYLFVVDIFNEGVDIPSLNQIIMLRPTESAIVFVQQLGRGLRKCAGKESVLVLDFIGNYQNNYLIPIALSGDRTYNKDNLRRFVKEGSTVIPGCSTVSFDRISEERIFSRIDASRFSETRLIKGEYENLKQILGRIPTLADFDEQEAIDPLLIFDKFGSYHAFLSKYEKSYTVSFSQGKERMLKYVSQKLANGKRGLDLQVLRLAVTQGFADCVGVAPARMRSVAACLTNRFTLAGQRKNFAECVFVEEQDGGFKVAPGFALALADEEFRRQMLELLDFGLARNASGYGDLYDDTAFVLYEKYTLEDVCRLLNWSENAVPLNVGGYQYNAETNTFPVFINYNKSPEISDTIKYEDRFVSDRELIAISKQPRTMASPEILRLRAIAENGVQPYLFVRKNKDDADGGKEFYFLGKMWPTQEYTEIEVGGKPAVEIGYRLDKPVRPDIYDYLTGSIS